MYTVLQDELKTCMHCREDSSSAQQAELPSGLLQRLRTARPSCTQAGLQAVCMPSRNIRSVPDEPASLQITARCWRLTLLPLATARARPALRQGQLQPAAGQLLGLNGSTVLAGRTVLDRWRVAGQVCPGDGAAEQRPAQCRSALRS